MLPTLTLLALVACDSSIRYTDAERERILASSPLSSPPPDPTNAVADDPAAAQLGQYLFFDQRLSGTGEFSCATCHDPDLGFTDGQAFSETVGVTGRSSPTVLNTVFNRWYFWDGRADSAWAQALGPIESPVEMGGTRLAVAHHLADDAALRTAYEGVFGSLPDLSDTNRFPPVGRPVPDDPTDPHAVAWASMDEADQDATSRIYANVGKSIAAYERLLVRRDAPWDRFVAGLGDDDAAVMDAISREAQLGGQIAFGDRPGACRNCHESTNFYDKEFQNIGLAPRDGTDPDDPGRFGGVPKVLADPFNGVGVYSDDPDGTAVTKLAFLEVSDVRLGQFKTASLRNLGETAPYMHGGHFETLKDVVTFYSNLDEEPLVGHREALMAPLALSDDEIDAVVAFLESLEGAPLDEALTRAPASPVP